jgi:hypothetical protein
MTMQMTFQRNGVRGEAIVLAVSPDRMRIAERGRPDTVELNLHDGSWHDERGRRLEIETLIAIDNHAFADVAPRTLTAGSLL